MATDWMGALHSRAEFAKAVGRQIPDVLASPDLTVDQVTRLSQLLTKYRRDIDRALKRLVKEGAGDAIRKAMEILQALWNTIAEFVLCKLTSVLQEQSKRVHGRKDSQDAAARPSDQSPRTAMS
jgi:hypothetical protein